MCAPLCNHHSSQNLALCVVSSLFKKTLFKCGEGEDFSFGKAGITAENKASIDELMGIGYKLLTH